MKLPGSSPGLPKGVLSRTLWMHRPKCGGVAGACAHGLPGKLAERQQARQLRRTGLPLAEIDEARLRMRPYLHEGLDLAASIAFWSALTSIPPSQFQKPYRAVPDPTIRRAKHVHGCVSIDYSCSATHRSIMGLVIALLGDAVNPG
jgi:hypothetical protein